MAATANTTRNRGWVAAAVAGGLGLLLVGLAGPRFAAHLEALGGDAAVAALHAGRPLTAAQLDGLVESREAALAWLDDGRFRHEAGLGRLARSQSLPYADAEARQAELRAAADDLERAVARRPLDSHAWLRLAFARLLAGERTAAAAALAAGMRAAPAQHDQFEARLRLGAMLWDRLDEEGRELWAQQVRLLWRWRPQRLAALAHRSGPEQRARLTAALDVLPDAAADLEARLAR